MDFEFSNDLIIHSNISIVKVVIPCLFEKKKSVWKCQYNRSMHWLIEQIESLEESTNLKRSICVFLLVFCLWMQMGFCFKSCDLFCIYRTFHSLELTQLFLCFKKKEFKRLNCTQNYTRTICLVSHISIKKVWFSLCYTHSLIRCRFRMESC